MSHSQDVSGAKPVFEKKIEKDLVFWLAEGIPKPFKGNIYLTMSNQRLIIKL
jgi:hypothetical protein